MLELLAPAGDKKSFYAAINCGADAVYLGMDDFNARKKAENFNAENIAEMVRHAHFYGVKVYLTVNTILQNSEFKRMLDMVKVAVLAKIDGVIVQDLGAVRAISEAFPGLEIHLSTQAGIHNVYGALRAKRLGAKRVVLARETKLEDIAAIKRETDLELEYFIQGALCVCFSGNCYLSATECNASGNRGECKQLCRLPYEMRGRTGYMLSARDMSLACDLAALAEAGVTSFKIEGRMRRESYVGASVRVFRKLLDALERGEPAVPSEEDMYALKVSFSRGEYLRRGYLDRGTPDVIESGYNNHSGVKIGAVTAVKPFKQGLYEVYIRSERPINSGDGLKFFVDGVEAASLGVGDARKVADGVYSFVTATRVPNGAEARLTLDSKLEEEILGIRRYVDADMSVNAKCGEPLCVTASAKYMTDDGYMAESAYSAWQDGVLERARTAPTDASELKAQACKTADTGFVAAHCEVTTDGAFVAKSVINGLRREALEGLKQKLIVARERAVEIDEDALARYQAVREGESVRPDYSLIAIKSEELTSPMRIDKCQTAVLCPSQYSASEIERMLSLLGLQADEVILRLPPVANGRDIKVIEELLREENGINTLLAENIYGFEYADRGYRVVAGAGLNIANDLAAEECVGLGASAVVASMEYPLAISGEADYPVFGMRMPLMTFAHCPFKTRYGCDCAHCAYDGNMTLSRGGKKYVVRRVKLDKCYFELYGQDDK